MRPLRTIASRFLPIALLVIGTGLTLSGHGSVLDNAVRAEDPESDGGTTDEPKFNRKTFIDDKGYEVTLEPIAPGSKEYKVVSRRRVWSKKLPQILLAAILGIAFVSLLYYAKYRVDRRVIIREVRDHQGTVESIRSETGLINRTWYVTYLDQNGKRCEDTCYLQQGWGPSVYWKSGFQHAARLRPLPTVRIKCQCGEMLDVNLSQAGLVIRCPSCSQEVSVPSRSGLQRLDG